MKKKTDFMQKDYERVSRLLGDLFEVNSDIIEQIYCHIQKNGIAFGFSPDVVEKLNAVGMVLYGIGEKSLSDVQNTKDRGGGVIYARKL